MIVPGGSVSATPPTPSRLGGVAHFATATEAGVDFPPTYAYGLSDADHHGKDPPGARMPNTITTHTALIEPTASDGHGHSRWQYRGWCDGCDWSGEWHTNEDDAQNDAAAHVDQATVPAVKPPEWFDIAAAASTLVFELDYPDSDPWSKGRQTGLLNMWQSLTGITDPSTAVSYARQVAATEGHVRAYIPTL